MHFERFLHSGWCTWTTTYFSFTRVKQGSCNTSFGKIQQETNTEQMLRMDEKKFRKVKLSTLAKQSNQLCCSFKIGLACICRILMNKIISQSNVRIREGWSNSNTGWNQIIICHCSSVKTLTFLIYGEGVKEERLL